eukprot:5396-Pelagococcus_subviridis.AAC.1
MSWRPPGAAASAAAAVAAWCAAAACAAACFIASFAPWTRPERFPAPPRPWRLAPPGVHAAAANRALTVAATWSFAAPAESAAD